MQYVAVILLVVPFLVQANKLVGGPQPAQLSEERRNELVQHSVSAINAQMNSPFVHKAVGDATITSQVVNGVIYKVNLDVVETDCRKGVVGKKCNVKSNAKNLKCKVDIHEQPWLNHRSVTVNGCNPK